MDSGIGWGNKLNVVCGTNNIILNLYYILQLQKNKLICFFKCTPTGTISTMVLCTHRHVHLCAPVRVFF